MSYPIAAPVRRLHPLTGVLLATALVASLVLGFAIRVWTENGPTQVSPTVTTPAQVAPPPSFCRPAQPC